MKTAFNLLQKLSISIMVLSLVGVIISAKYPLPSIWYSTSVNYHAAADFCSVLFWRFLLLIFSVQGLFAGIVLFAIAWLGKISEK